MLFALILPLSGCVSLVSNQAPVARLMPIKPELMSITPTPDGGICMDKHDAAELLIYIEALERAAGGPQ